MCKFISMHHTHSDLLRCADRRNLRWAPQHMIAFGWDVADGLIAIASTTRHCVSIKLGSSQSPPPALDLIWGVPWKSFKRWCRIKGEWLYLLWSLLRSFWHVHCHQNRCPNFALAKNPLHSKIGWADSVSLFYVRQYVIYRPFCHAHNPPFRKLPESHQKLLYN